MVTTLLPVAASLAVRVKEHLRVSALTLNAALPLRWQIVVCGSCGSATGGSGLGGCGAGCGAGGCGTGAGGFGTGGFGTGGSGIGGCGLGSDTGGRGADGREVPPEVMGVGISACAAEAESIAETARTTPNDALRKLLVFFI